MSIKMKLYRKLTDSNFRRFVSRTENFLSEKMPTVHKKIFLPMKAAAKSALLKFAMTSKSKRNGNSKTNGDEKLAETWNYAPRAERTENFFVSIIVPNFNHAQYLRERLNSIYNQTYKNFEVILLDDYSTDNSREILQEFYDAHKDNTRIIFNEKNSGGVFKQWRRGIEAARGNLIWIAESDDYSSENFLSELIPAFSDRAVQLAFARSDFIQDGKKIFSTEQYLVDLENFDWSKSFAMTAANFVMHGMAIKNIIPNVSSVVFKKPSEIHAEVAELWNDMKLCGDWVFYLDLIKGGCVYYTPSATNFYRVHQNSTSLKIQKTPAYYLEHEKIAEFIAKNYLVPPEIHEKHFKLLEDHFFTYYGGEDISELKKYFDLEKIWSIKRKPNILMCVFSMSIGGGETFPLILANELGRKNFPVTVLDFQMSEDLPGIRKKLREDLPLVRIKETAGLSTIIEQFKIDIVHSHHGSTDEAISYISAGNKNFRHVVTLHGMYEAMESASLNNLLQKVQKSVDAFVYITEKNLQPFKNFGMDVAEKFYKIGNGLELAPVNPVSRAELDISENSFVCCVVSRAIPEKGWQPAVDAVTLANKKSSRRIDLILVGSGVMYDRLKGNVPEFVHLVGFKSNVRDYLATADAGLLPSEFAGESFPLMIIDSLFSGRPVISSNIGESATMLKTSSGESAGVIIDLENGKIPVKKLSEILIELANDDKKFQKLREQVPEAAKKFFIDTVTEKYLKVYRNVFGDFPD